MRRISLVATFLILSGYFIIPIANGLSNNALISSFGTISYVVRLPFSDDFGGDLSQWTEMSFTSHRWEIVFFENNRALEGYVQDGPSFILAGSEGWMNYDFSAKTYVFPEGELDSQLVFHYIDNNNYYFAGLGAWAHKYGIGKVVKGVPIELITVGSREEIVTETWYNLRVVINKDKIDLYVNNVLELTTYDSDLTNGKIGLRLHWSSHAYFDDVIVQEVSQTSPPFTSSSFGVHVWNHPDQALQIGRVKELAVSWVRYMIYWPEVEPSKGSYNWGAADKTINNAKANGLKIVVLVNGVASWAGYGGYVDYGNFVYVVVKRYNPDAVELMNEPGIEHPSISASQYVNFIKYGYQRAKEAKSNIPAIAGFGQVSQPVECDGTFGTLDLAKLQPLGFFNYVDGLVIHPYTYGADPDTWTGHGYTKYSSLVGVAGVIRYLRDRLTSWGKATIPLWATEFGFFDAIGVELQKQYTIRECEILRDANVVTIFYYCFWVPASDTRAYPITLVNDDSTLSAKPLYNAYRDFLI